MPPVCLVFWLSYDQQELKFKWKGEKLEQLPQVKQGGQLQDRTKQKKNTGQSATITNPLR